MLIRLLLLAFLFQSCASSTPNPNTVTVYSVYPADQLAELFAPFSRESGIEVKFVDGSSTELLKRLQDEGAATNADLYLDKDLVYLGQAKKLGLTQPFSSKFIEQRVPGHLIDSDKHWATIFYRSRVIMYNSEKVKPSELSTYQSLGDKKWHNRLCMRTSSNSYNQALTAYLIKHLGRDKALAVLKGWVNNLSVKPLKNDRAVIQAVANGECDVGLANSYYLPAFLRKDKTFPVRPFFPNQKTHGAHINGIGIAVVKHTKNLQNATRFMEHFFSDAVQTPLAAQFSQYPASTKAERSDVLENFGKFLEDKTNIGEISRYTQEAETLFPVAKYQ